MLISGQLLAGCLLSYRSCRRARLTYESIGCNIHYTIVKLKLIATACLNTEQQHMAGEAGRGVLQVQIVTPLP